MKSTSAWVIASCLLVACGGDDTTTGGGASNATTGSAGSTSTSAGSTSTGAGGSSAGAAGDMGAAGALATGGAAGATGVGGAVGVGGAAGSGPQLPADETLCGMVTITPDAGKMTKTIAAGKVTAVCAGAVVTIPMGVSITVQGTLRVDGTSAMPAKFQGAAHGSQGWEGLVLASGGKLAMTYGEIHDAVMPIDSKAGADFQVDHIVIDNSKNLLHFASGGTMNHAALHGLGAMQGKDPIVVDNASPHLSNTLVDKGNTGMDFITVNGGTPVFDYMDITSCHCAFHFNAGTGITISNSNIHGNAYGLMVEGSTTNSIVHNNFTANNPNIGDCGGGSSATVKDNYFQGPAFAANCPKLTSTTPAGAAYPLTGTGAVGPQP